MPFPPGVALEGTRMPFHQGPSPRMGMVRPATPAIESPQEMYLREIHDFINILQKSLALEVKCSRGGVREEKHKTLTYEINQIIQRAHKVLSIENQVSIYMHVAVLLQSCNCYESAKHYLLTCSGFITEKASSQEAKKIAECVRHHTTLPKPYKGTNLPPVIESEGLSRYMDNVKLEGMVRLAWNNAKWLLEQLDKEEFNPQAAQQKNNASNLYSLLVKTLRNVDQTNRCHQLSLVLRDLLAEAHCVRVMNPRDLRPSPDRSQSMSPERATE
ncbi:hypothetical protein M3P05_18585 [Sansalvadorimonas sp. 2012CJ34-2]|uniref:Uncharacterized protein n=1 Tax=Parendozoicomonas callyspongiae TaxID=2942213 RepID=A0ABT0PKL5_9GAMM|nr:hypothetical protein [Sansalvadorimonas sp. 2012CJ34-2]MCL6271930.1 hypothetical protein [Sansalvadorimonas sp. 2012CJ34-2]